jgi:hypothetical protein
MDSASTGSPVGQPFAEPASGVLSPRAGPGADRLPLDAFDLAPAEVKRRFRWAAQQGNPYWLWPDIAVADWVSALERITQVTSEVLLAGRARSALDGDPAALGVAGFTSGMGPCWGSGSKPGNLLPLGR